MRLVGNHRQVRPLPYYEAKNETETKEDTLMGGILIAKKLLEKKDKKECKQPQQAGNVTNITNNYYGQPPGQQGLNPYRQAGAGACGCSNGMDPTSMTMGLLAGVLSGGAGQPGVGNVGMNMGMGGFLAGFGRSF